MLNAERRNRVMIDAETQRAARAQRTAEGYDAPLAGEAVEFKISKWKISNLRQEKRFRLRRYHFRLVLETLR